MSSYQLIIVDASVLQYSVNFDLRNRELVDRVFALESNDPDVADVVDKYTKAFLKELQSIIGTRRPDEIVFEGSSDKSKRRAALRVVNVSRTMNAAIRHRYLSPSPAVKAIGKKSIAKNMGRPPVWFARLVVKELKNQGYKALLVTKMQADQAIVCHANGLKTGNIAVVSSDRDFLALASTSKIDTILFRQGGLVRSLDKKEVLTELGVTGEKLQVAYCLGGCDDVETKLDGVGFSVALAAVKWLGDTTPCTSKNLGKLLDWVSTNSLESALEEAAKLLKWYAFPLYFDL